MMGANLVSGNTDCKVYYNLSRNVYRFMALPEDAAFGMVSRIQSLVRWLITYIAHRQ
jgi:hypothetical protein